MHHNLEVDFLGKWQILTPWAGKLLTVVIWSRSFWSFSTWERGYLLTIYKYLIFIIVAILTLGNRF